MSLRTAVPAPESDRLAADRPASPMQEGLQALEFVGLDHQPPANAPRVMPIAAVESLGDHPLRQVKAHLTVRVGSLDLTVGELLGARQEQVFRLDRTVEQPVDLLLEGQVVARGTLVAIGEYFGVRITELPRPFAP